MLSRSTRDEAENSSRCHELGRSRRAGSSSQPLALQRCLGSVCQAHAACQACRVERERPPRSNGVGTASGQGQNRTADTRIFSPLLYQLSYLAEGRETSSATNTFASGSVNGLLTPPTHSGTTAGLVTPFSR